MSRFIDAIHVLTGRAEIVFNEELALVERFLTNEEKEIEAMITDALNNLANAISAVLAERSSDKAAIAQANAERDAANAAAVQAGADRDVAQAQVSELQGQLSDAESQINALIAQINPPAA